LISRTNIIFFGILDSISLVECIERVSSSRIMPRQWLPFWSWCYNL